MASTMSEYAVRKNKIVAHLGGKCVVCATTSDLQVDHVNHENKSFTVLNNWARSWDYLIIELAKCQLLCRKHHLEKSIEEGSLAKGWTNQKRAQHGTAWMYSKYHCRCDLCKKAKSIRMRDERIAKLLKIKMQIPRAK